MAQREMTRKRMKGITLPLARVPRTQNTAKNMMGRIKTRRVSRIASLASSAMVAMSL